MEEPEGPLAALTVLDLSEGSAGPYAARLFAEQGARVIKVERPGGDVARGWPAGRPGLLFAALNAGKLGLTLDYGTEAGAAVLRELVGHADALIEDHPSRRRADLGIGDDDLIQLAPRLVIGRVAGFGPGGPYRDRPLTTLTLAAAAGLLSPEDTAFHRPLEQVVGVHLFLAVLAGLWRAAQTEHGQVVEVGGLEALAATAGQPLAERLSGGAGGSLAEGPGRPPDLASLRAAGLLLEAEAPGFGRLPFPLPPFNMAGGPLPPLAPAPARGEHTDHVLSDILGLEAAALAALRERGVV